MVQELCTHIQIVRIRWSLHPSNPTQDFKRFDFFQTLCKSDCVQDQLIVSGLADSMRDLIAIVGGLLLLVNMGPGGLSMDEKKKVSFLFVNTKIGLLTSILLPGILGP